MYPMFRVDVAVKTCTRTSGYDDIEREARVFMKLTERHMNIVNLLGNLSKTLHVNLLIVLSLGVCIPSTEDDLIPMLLLELCEVNVLIFEQIDTTVLLTVDTSPSRSFLIIIQYQTNNMFFLSTLFVFSYLSLP